MTYWTYETGRAISGCANAPTGWLTRRHTYVNTRGIKETAEAELDETDLVYTSVRHQHMKDAIDVLQTDFNRFNMDHAAFQTRDEDDGG